MGLVKKHVLLNMFEKYPFPGDEDGQKIKEKSLHILKQLEGEEVRLVKYIIAEIIAMIDVNSAITFKPPNQ